ncbi:MAG TPA: thiol peroxidase [Leptospiraceae bacterium]|jgi:thiol peroxidase|nr:thiol peroxidase [Leptospirales bacterium]HMU83864.1 thiol peroxidase [Leptospiraceae bacterium]HMW60030.1 thiol peroxidase [Leptospiraceae bacterium]HMX55977.1 thiol peroxidase [Leptospiraceae bacterium]HMY44899.1 thiol peroxidase [Leptospiraceae bacterium]
MASVTHRGNTIQLDGNLPRPGEKAPGFKVVKDDLSEVGLESFAGKVKVIVALPSLDTPVCQKETREFNQKLGSMKDTVVLVVSGDLPFAMKRFCSTEGLSNVVTGSQFRDHAFSHAYGTFITEGGLKGLSARAVFVVDKNDTVQYTELVPDIGGEPDYNAVSQAVSKLVG